MMTQGEVTTSRDGREANNDDHNNDDVVVIITAGGRQRGNVGKKGGADD
jgi:hypothetical protein